MLNNLVGPTAETERQIIHWLPQRLRMTPFTSVAISFYFVASWNRLFTQNKGFIQVYNNDLPILQIKPRIMIRHFTAIDHHQLPVWSSLRSVPKTLFNTSRAIKHIHLGPDPSCTCGPTVQSIGHSIAESVWPHLLNESLLINPHTKRIFRRLSGLCPLEWSVWQ